MASIDSREWSKLFPNEINNELDSKLFIHRFFTVTLSALTAKRRIFTSNHFSSKKLGHHYLPLFTRPSSFIEQKRFNSTVFNWIQAVSQGISKSYLKLAKFYVISKLDNSVLEIYEYYFAYNNDQSDSMNESFSTINSTEDLQQQVLKSLDEIDRFVDENLQPIRKRSNYRFSLNIEYNSKTTPTDYEPIGFYNPETLDSPIDWKRILSEKIKSSRRILAQIKTKHHKMLLVHRIPNDQKKLTILNGK